MGFLWVSFPFYRKGLAFGTRKLNRFYTFAFIFAIYHVCILRVVA